MKEETVRAKHITERPHYLQIPSIVTSVGQTNIKLFPRGKPLSYTIYSIVIAI